MRLERYAAAFQLAEELLRGPVNPRNPYWYSSLLAARATALMRQGKDVGFPVRLADRRFGNRVEDCADWASFVFEHAHKQGDWATAHEAAVAMDRWNRSRGHEALPVSAAWALADLAYRQAWEDGPSTHDRGAVRLAGELLDELGMARPRLPSTEPDPDSVPLASELSAWLKELRTPPPIDPGDARAGN